MAQKADKIFGAEEQPFLGYTRTRGGGGGGLSLGEPPPPFTASGHLLQFFQQSEKRGCAGRGQVLLNIMTF